MTVEQHFRNRLTDIGLAFLPQNLAMEYAKAHDRMKPMRDRWDTPYDERDATLNNVIWFCLRARVGEWLDANMPDFPSREAFR